jgi:hypothetical protein
MLKPPFHAQSIGQLVLKITRGRYTPVCHNGCVLAIS